MDLTLRELCAWAEHPDVDGALLQQAISIVDTHRKQTIPVEVANFAKAVMVRNTLGADAFTISELVDQSRLLPVLLSTEFPGEQSRSYRLLNALESHDVSEMASFRGQQDAGATGNGIGMSEWFNRSAATRFELSEAIETTPLFALIVSGPAQGQLCLRDVLTECEIRATKTVMRLLDEQLKSGELPTTLEDFDASWNDPWTGKPFTWYSKGLPYALKRSSSVIVEANTPFLVSLGTGQFHLLPDDSEDAVQLPGSSSDYSGVQIWKVPKRVDEESSAEEAN